MTEIMEDEEENDSTDTLLTPSNEQKGKKKRFRFFLGVVALVLVDIIWVASSEMSNFLFTDFHFDKPYMSTYIKTSMFSIYLFGFIIYAPWRRQCIRCSCDDYPGQYQLVGETDTEDTEDTDDGDYISRNSLSESMYVPANLPSASEIESCSDGEKRNKIPNQQTRVKFNNLMEVRHLDDCRDSQLARMNYAASIQAKYLRRKNKGKLTVPQVVRISFIFSLIFFLGNLSYQEALAIDEVAVVNILSSTSGIFTLVLAAMFPSGSTDKFTLTKLVAVLMSFGGVVLVTVATSDSDLSKLVFSNKTIAGALWSLLGAFCYAVYLVFLKKSIGETGQMDVPMFFGFVGLFSFSLCWPGMLAFHFLQLEPFQLPDKTSALIMVVNGLVGTVISELLWLWGCLATSSLAGTMSLSLTMPLSILVDIFIRNAHYSWIFYAGVAPVFLSFVIVTYLAHKNPPKDPLVTCFKKCFCCCCHNK